MFSFDLKSGYYHIGIHRNTKLTSDSGDEIFYIYTFLPFGLSTAPYVFSKLLEQLEKHWRLQGICMAIFLDSGWATVQDHRQDCQTTAQAVRNDFGQL